MSKPFVVVHGSSVDTFVRMTTCLNVERLANGSAFIKGVVTTGCGQNDKPSSKDGRVTTGRSFPVASSRRVMSERCVMTADIFLDLVTVRS